MIPRPLYISNDGLLVTSKLCTYYSAVGSTDFVSCRNIPCTALKASASRAGGLVDVIIYVASGSPGYKPMF